MPFTMNFPTKMTFHLRSSQEMFDWNRAWYPIAPLEYLNADAPNPVKLLGKRMVLWCSNQDTWSG